MKVLYIEWIDAVSESGWDKPDKLDIHECKSIGFLVKETMVSYILAAAISSDNSECNASIAIPKAWIKKKKWVKI